MILFPIITILIVFSFDNILARHIDGKRRHRSFDPKIFTTCIDGLGCIDVSEKWYDADYRPNNPEPLDRNTIRTEFILMKSLQNNSKDLVYDILQLRKETIDIAGFKAGACTKIMIHDFTSNGRTGWIKHLVVAFAHRTDCNLVSIDWEAGAEPPFEQAIVNARVVALEAQAMINMLKVNFSQSLETIHVIGHGIGCHIAGYIGKNISGLGRITGLDPTGPYFERMPKEVRLDYSDANYVEVIHTDAYRKKSQGSSTQLGHSDFYVNNAGHQPGCNESELLFTDIRRDGLKEGKILPSCSHKRSFKYYIESVESSNCQFVGVSCKNFEEFEKGQCFSCENNGCLAFGLESPAAMSTWNHSYYLITHDKKPFCALAYTVTMLIDTNTKAREVEGYFDMILVDSNNVLANATTVNSEFKYRSIKPGGHHQFLFYTLPPRLGVIKEAKVRWNRKSFKLCLFCTTSVYVNQIEIRPLDLLHENTITSYLCPKRDTTEIEDGDFVTFTLCNAKSCCVTNAGNETSGQVNSTTTNPELPQKEQTFTKTVQNGMDQAEEVKTNLQAAHGADNSEVFNISNPTSSETPNSFDVNKNSKSDSTVQESSTPSNNVDIENLYTSSIAPVMVSKSDVFELKTTPSIGDEEQSTTSTKYNFETSATFESLTSETETERYKETSSLFNDFSTTSTRSYKDFIIDNISPTENSLTTSSTTTRFSFDEPLKETEILPLTSTETSTALDTFRITDASSVNNVMTSSFTSSMQETSSKLTSPAGEIERICGKLRVVSGNNKVMKFRNIPVPEEDITIPTVDPGLLVVNGGYMGNLCNSECNHEDIDHRVKPKQQQQGQDLEAREGHQENVRKSRGKGDKSRSRKDTRSKKIKSKAKRKFMNVTTSVSTLFTTKRHATGSRREAKKKYRRVTAKPTTVGLLKIVDPSTCADIKEEFNPNYDKVKLGLTELDEKETGKSPAKAESEGEIIESKLKEEDFNILNVTDEQCNELGISKKKEKIELQEAEEGPVKGAANVKNKNVNIQNTLPDPMNDVCSGNLLSINETKLKERLHSAINELTKELKEVKASKQLRTKPAEDGIGTSCLHEPPEKSTTSHNYVKTKTKSKGRVEYVETDKTLSEPNVGAAKGPGSSKAIYNNDADEEEIIKSKADDLVKKVINPFYKNSPPLNNSFHSSFEDDIENNRCDAIISDNFTFTEVDIKDNYNGKSTMNEKKITVGADEIEDNSATKDTIEESETAIGLKKNKLPSKESQEIDEDIFAKNKIGAAHGSANKQMSFASKLEPSEEPTEVVNCVGSESSMQQVFTVAGRTTMDPAEKMNIIIKDRAKVAHVTCSDQGTDTNLNNNCNVNSKGMITKTQFGQGIKEIEEEKKPDVGAAKADTFSVTLPAPRDETINDLNNNLTEDLFTVASTHESTNRTNQSNVAEDECVDNMEEILRKLESSLSEILSLKKNKPTNLANANEGNKSAYPNPFKVEAGQCFCYGDLKKTTEVFETAERLENVTDSVNLAEDEQTEETTCYTVLQTDETISEEQTVTSSSAAPKKVEATTRPSALRTEEAQVVKDARTTKRQTTEKEPGTTVKSVEETSEKPTDLDTEATIATEMASMKSVTVSTVQENIAIGTEISQPSLMETISNESAKSTVVASSLGTSLAEGGQVVTTFKDAVENISSTVTTAQPSKFVPLTKVTQSEIQLVTDSSVPKAGQANADNAKITVDFAAIEVNDGKTTELLVIDMSVAASTAFNEQNVPSSATNSEIDLYVNNKANNSAIEVETKPHSGQVQADSSYMITDQPKTTPITSDDELYKAIKMCSELRKKRRQSRKRKSIVKRSNAQAGKYVVNIGNGRNLIRVPMKVVFDLKENGQVVGTTEFEIVHEDVSRYSTANSVLDSISDKPLHHLANSSLGGTNISVKQKKDGLSKRNQTKITITVENGTRNCSNVFYTSNKSDSTFNMSCLNPFVDKLKSQIDGEHRQDLNAIYNMPPATDQDQPAKAHLGKDEGDIPGGMMMIQDQINDDVLYRRNFKQNDLYGIDIIPEFFKMYGHDNELKQLESNPLDHNIQNESPLHDSTNITINVEHVKDTTLQNMSVESTKVEDQQTKFESSTKTTVECNEEESVVTNIGEVSSVTHPEDKPHKTFTVNPAEFKYCSCLMDEAKRLKEIEDSTKVEQTELAVGNYHVNASHVDAQPGFDTAQPISSIEMTQQILPQTTSDCTQQAIPSQSVLEIAQVVSESYPTTPNKSFFQEIQIYPQFINQSQASAANFNEVAVTFTPNYSEMPHEVTTEHLPETFCETIIVFKTSTKNPENNALEGDKVHQLKTLRNNDEENSRVDDIRFEKAQIACEPDQVDDDDQDITQYALRKPNSKYRPYRKRHHRNYYRRWHRIRD